MAVVFEISTAGLAGGLLNLYKGLLPAGLSSFENLPRAPVFSASAKAA